MDKTLDTLRDDMYAVADGSTPLKDEEIAEYAKTFAKGLEEKFTTFLKRSRRPDKFTGAVRLSSIGSPCARKLWYKQQQLETDEPLPPWVLIKFFFGDMVESLMESLVTASGHKLEGQQDTLHFAGVEGHRDGKIDGHTIDFKSASTFSFKKQASGKLTEDDPFGYLTQLHTYDYADPERDATKSPAIVAMDKQHGHIAVVEYPVTISKEQLKADVNERVLEVTGDAVPPRPFSDEPQGKSGNMKLQTVCSYCDFKQRCWPELRTFIYSNGPVFLTSVTKTPAVPELVDGEIKREEF